MGEFAIGQGVSRFEDPRLIQGGGRYTDDIKLPGMVHGVVLRSPHAHAKIKSLDTAAAKAAPGVLCRSHRGRREGGRLRRSARA